MQYVVVQHCSESITGDPDINGSIARVFTWSTWWEL